MLFHFVKLHWRTILVVIAFALLVWICLPSAMKTKVSTAWKRFGRAIGNFNARVLLTALYAIVIMPFGLVVRFFSDALHTKKRPQAWFDHPPIPNTLEEARRQG